MIHSQELRIGNIINYSGNKQKISGIHTGFVNLEFLYEQTDNPSFSLRSRDIEIKDIESIPLTKSILLACGFEQIKDKQTYILNLDTYFLSPTIKLYAYLNKGTVYNLRMIQGQNKLGNMLTISCVHELQNLFYTLTRNELEINL